MKHEAHETTAEAAEYHVRNPRASPKRTKLRLYTRLFYSFNFNPARRDLHIRYIMHHSQEHMSLRSGDVCRPHTWHVHMPNKGDRSEASSALVARVALARGGVREPEGSKTQQNTSMALAQYFGTQPSKDGAYVLPSSFLRNCLRFTVAHALARILN